MKAHLVRYMLVILGIATFTSCSDITDNAKKASTGGVNEVLVITDNLPQWRGEIGDSIRALFTQDMGILPRSEPQFNLVHMQPNALHKEMFKKHHNIFLIHTDSNLHKPEVKRKHNVWAEPQCMIQINSKTPAEFLQLFDSLKNPILDAFVKNERARIAKAYSSKFKETAISAELKKQFKLDMDIPKGYYIATMQADFAWIRKETAANSMNILIYTEPYSSINQLKPYALQKSRNKVTSLHIPGPTPNSYQIIADEDIEPEVKEVNYNGLYAQEMRGLWKVKNDFMGGGFISYSFVDESTNTLITIDGFAYAPKQKKAPVMRELEAMLWSYKLINKQKETQE